MVRHPESICPLQPRKNPSTPRKEVGKLKEIGPWARFFKDEAPPDEEFPEDAPEDAGPADDEGGEVQPELETMEVPNNPASMLNLTASASIVSPSPRAGQSPALSLLA